MNTEAFGILAGIALIVAACHFSGTPISLTEADRKRADWQRCIDSLKHRPVEEIVKVCGGKPL